MAGWDKEKQNEAERLYRQGEKLVSIADKLDIPVGTVRSWKNRCGWDGGSVAEKKRNVAKGKKNATLQKKDACEGRTGDGGTRRDKLTGKQELFCQLYVRCFNATKAYQKAYKCSYETAMVEGCKNLRNPKIKDEIQRLKQGRYNRELLHEDDIFQKYMDIAFADITDYIEFGTREVSMLNEVTGRMESIPVNYVNIRDSTKVDGTIISEVSRGKDGVKVKLADRMQALKWLADHMDLATDEQKARIESLKAKDAGNRSGGGNIDEWISSVMDYNPEEDGGKE